MFVEHKGGIAMLEPIGESAVRMTTRTDHQQAFDHKATAHEKAEKAAEERPVESTQETTADDTADEQKTGGYNADEDGIFFEKYDKNGNVVLRVPPEQKPIDEHA
jgi:hypothetical protein